MGTQGQARNRIDFDKLDAIIQTFSKSTKYKKKQTYKAPRKDPLLEKHEREARWLKLKKEGKRLRREDLAKQYKAFARWMKFMREEIKLGECGLDEYGLLDTDYIATAEDLELHTLPHVARKECLWLFYDLIRSVKKRVKSDPLDCFDNPRPASLKLDFDEMSQYLEKGY